MARLRVYSNRHWCRQGAEKVSPQFLIEKTTRSVPVIILAGCADNRSELLRTSNMCCNARKLIGRLLNCREVLSWKRAVQVALQ